MGWIAVDLDGTLAHWGQGHNTDVMQIGTPIPRMVDRVKGWLAEGKDVRIFTARVAASGLTDGNGATDDQAFADFQRRLVQDWCVEHLGTALPVTATKDFHMYQLWDDRCVQVIPNTGEALMEAGV